MISNFLRRASSGTANLAFSTNNFLSFVSKLPNRTFQACTDDALKPWSINVMQIRQKTVLKDAMEPHRIFRFDKVDGKRTEAEIVYKCFYRLNWGCWIRTRGGREKKLYKKYGDVRRRLRQHVMCNAQQSRLLDRLTLHHVKRRHYYPDDPYEPYHSREEYKVTRNAPLPPSKNVEQFLD